ncbi:MAG: hypothetical protein HYR88_10535 [Verrucomicrobia bacterium]|nr:hypothetical protein [Verrucomicrobiota bacterium]
MMTIGLRARVAAFAGSLLLLLGLLVWAALASWDRVAQLRERLTLVNLESFRLADHFQKEVLSLNNLMMEVEIQKNESAWVNFRDHGDQLDRWIDLQKPALRTDRERDVLRDIDSVYDDYKAAAMRMATHRLRESETGEAALQDVGRFERESERLQNLGFALADAHRESLDQFLSASNRSLLVLRGLTLAALALLAVFGMWLAAVVYQRMIQPLEVQLVEAQAVLERSEKLASLGVLAAGVAHEIRGPLTAMKARAFMLQRRHEAGTPDREAADLIEGEISRLERIVKDVLSFARPGEPEMARIEVGSLLTDVHSLLRAQMEKNGHRLELELETQAVVQGDAQQLKQALINLVQNASEAVGSNGWIRMRARRGEEWLHGRLVAVVVLEVQDNGSGIAPEVKKRLFDPFFTTKPSGTGLGLPLSSKIIEKHGGLLQYQTQVGVGTTFGIVLPLPNETA